MIDYSCGAVFCDDPACTTHSAKDADGKVKYRPLQDGDFTWKNKGPQDILADVNSLLSEIAFPPESAPDSLLIPFSTYWWLRRGMVDLLLRSRKARRPKRFTRK